MQSRSEKECKLKIIQLQKFSIHDGPGIRTTVFTKGCSLHCYWCHNPESILPAIRLWRMENRCIRCASCKNACPKGITYGEEGCDCTEETGFPCADACPAGGLIPDGTWMDKEEIIKVLLQDQSYYERTGGGVTFSGGEPLLQAENLAEILSDVRLCHTHKAVDTAGNVPWTAFEKLLPFADLFLYDMKCADPDLHRRGTGSSNHRILENLRLLCETGKEVWIRIPVIPGFNDHPEELGAMAEKLKELCGIPGCGISRIQLLPFHRFGQEKYERLGLVYKGENLEPPSQDRMKELCLFFHKKGVVKAETGNCFIGRKDSERC